MDYQQQPPPNSDPSPSPSDRPAGITSPETPSNSQNHEIEDIMACVTALEAALLPCLPARELQAMDRSPQPSHQSQSLFLFSRSRLRTISALWPFNFKF